MTQKTRIISVALAICLLAVPAMAAFDNFDISPRARAMGDAGVAIADDAFAPYFNPAGIGYMDESSVGNSYVKPFGVSFTDQMYFGGVVQTGTQLGNLGFGVRRFATEYKNIDLHTETTYTLAKGFKIYEDMHSSVSFGVALNAYQLEFGETVTGMEPGDDITVSGDVGLMVKLHARTKVGVMVKNINNPKIGLDNEELGQRLHGGVAYQPYAGVTTSFEFENTIDGETQYHGGAEFTVLDFLHLRAGVMTNPNKLTFGFGYAYRTLVLNYGFSTGGGVLPDSHQFGLTFAWGGEAK